MDTTTTSEASLSDRPVNAARDHKWDVANGYWNPETGETYR